MYNRKLSESKYSNWIKAGLAVLFTKEGIEPFVYDEIDQFRQNCLTDICNNNGLPAGATCSYCCTENVVVCPTNRICNVGRGKCNFHRNSATQYLPSGCPNQICHNFKNEIQRAHRFYGPSYKNTDATQWCSNPWEVAKCFMPPDGYKDVASVTETDFNGINSVIINYKDFQSKVHDDLSKKGSIFDKGKDIGKAVRHSPTLEVEDTDLQQYFTDLQNLLSDPAYLATNTTAQNARKKLSQLQNDTLVIGKDDVRKVLSDVAKAAQDKIRSEMNEHRKEAEKQKLRLIETTNNSLCAIDGQEKISISELNKVSKSAVDQIENVTNESVKRIKEETKKGLRILADTGNTAMERGKEDVHRMKTEADAGVVKIASEIDNALQQVKEGADKGMKTFETEADARVKQLQTETDRGVKRLTSETETAKKRVKVGADEVIERLQKHADDREKTITLETDSALKRVKVCVNEGVEMIETETYTGIKMISSETNNAEQLIQTTSNEQIKKMETEAATGLKRIASEAAQTILCIKEKLTTANKQSEDDNYNKVKQDFKSDLLAFNQHYHSTIPLSPIFEEHDTSLQGFYVQPDMNSIEVQKTTFSGPAVEIRKSIKSLKDVFYRKSKDCENIYLTSGAGQGKTVFCKYLVLAWCQAHGSHSNESRLFAEEDIQVMKDFEYIFLVSLRDCGKHCDVDDMIESQIVQHLGQIYTLQFIQTLLHREKYLVLLDGLDEWSHPVPSLTLCEKKQDGLPHRNIRKNCTILTTTRSWKLSVVILKSSQIDNHIEIGDLDEDNSRQLIANAVRKILNLDEDAETKANYQFEVQIRQVEGEISSRSTPEFETNPLLLTYMICLVCDGKSLGRSKFELYANILDFLLHRWEKRNKTTDTVTAENTIDSVLLPAVFKNCSHTRTYEKFLLSLGQLAFKALFCENEERSLVFESSLMDSCLTAEEHRLSLLAGILIQTKLPGTLTTRETLVSFSHKTFQEFFAALYIYSKADLNDVKEPVLKKCNSLENILEMSNVFTFLSGICPERLRALSKYLSNVINDDDMRTEYSCVQQLFYMDPKKPAKNLQNMYIACVKESQDANHEIVYPVLEDVIIDSDRNKEGHLQMLQNLIKTNIDNIKSIWLSHFESETDTQELIRNLNLEKIHTLESLKLISPIVSEDLTQILAGSVNTLKQVAACNTMPKRGTVYYCKYGTLLDTSVKSIQNMNYLISLHLTRFKMSHHLLESLIAHLKQKTCMKQIFLCDIKCIDHDESCPGFSMDLSQHAQLTTVGLVNLPLVHVEINTSTLEECYTGPLQTSSAVSSFLNSLPDARKLRLFFCESMRNETNLNTMMAIIPQLVTVTYIVIGNTDINNKVLQLHPDNVNIELILMQDTTMSSSSLEQLVQQVQQFQQSVLVVLQECTVTPAEEYERIKYKIKSSDRFEVVCDGEEEDVLGLKWNVFGFKTNKT